MFLCCNYVDWFLPSATKLRRLCFYRCVSVHRGVLSQYALQVVSQYALQQVSKGDSIPVCITGGIPVCFAAGLQGGCYPSMHCRWYPSMPCSMSLGGACAGGGACSGRAYSRGACSGRCGLLLWSSVMAFCLVAFWLKVAFWYGILGPPQKAITEGTTPEGHNRRPLSTRRPPSIRRHQTRRP